MFLVYHRFHVCKTTNSAKTEPNLQPGDDTMLKIAICDDTTEERELVEQYAKRYFEARNQPAEFETFGSMQAVLDIGNSYDLYLLDVLMPGKSGIQGAADLLKLYSDPVIVFITSSLESAVDSYRVCASGFLLKPVRWEDFEETMDRVCRQKLSLPDACLSVVVNRVMVNLPLNRISHFENRLHKVYATLTDGSVIPLSQKLSAILESFSEQKIFLRCHQSYIVNLTHVHALEDSTFQMEDGTSIPISRAFYKEAKNAYYHYRLR